MHHVDAVCERLRFVKSGWWIARKDPSCARQVNKSCRLRRFGGAGELVPFERDARLPGPMTTRPGSIVPLTPNQPCRLHQVLCIYWTPAAFARSVRGDHFRR